MMAPDRLPRGGFATPAASVLAGRMASIDKTARGAGFLEDRRRRLGTLEPSLEGAGIWQTMLRVTMPLTLPGLSVTAIYTFIAAWGAFIAPLILDGDPGHEPAPIAIFHFMGNHGEFLFGQLAAYSLLFSLPVVLLYFALSRQFSGAFTFGGGLKG